MSATSHPGIHIAGVTQAGRGPVIEIVNPATGEVIDAITSASLQDVAEAAAGAQQAQREWATKTPGERSKILLDLAGLIEEDAEHLTRLEVDETGKPRAVFQDGELPFAADNLRFFAGAGRSLAGTAAAELSHGFTSLLMRQPVGVIGSITPWNFPFIMAIWKIGPALVTGNAVVLKPAPNTPRSSLRLAELAIQAGLPPGLLNVVTGGNDVGEALVIDPHTAMISITGSTRAGQAVMAAASPFVKRLHLELGGKAPAIVFPDADIESMARALTLGATYNTGQDCTAATRVYAQKDMYQDVVDSLAATMARVKVGDPWADDTDIGPVVSAEHLDRIHGFVTRAEQAGATIAAGGERLDKRGNYYPPTLVIGAKQESEIVQGEVFGPVLVVVPFEDETHALHLANDSQFGLASSVWTNDVSRALRVSQQIEAGVTWVNDHLPIASEAPHGGVKRSGFGKDMSHESLLEYTVTHHIMIKHAEPVIHDSFRPA
jgi:betaine-aldehyde dehydrogenase